MIKHVLASVLFTVSAQAWAVDFSVADAKFALRDSTPDRSAVLDARSAYKEIIDSGVSGPDRVRAVEGYLRTYFFEGTHFTTTLPEGTPETLVGSGRQTRKAIFNQAWTSAVELIPAESRDTSPVYYYFKASAIAYEAEVSSLLERLLLLPQLTFALERGLLVEGSRSYEGGGLLRVKAAVKGNPEAKGLPGGLYNPTEALNLVNEAIASSAYPDNAEGMFFCENFRRKVITQRELGDLAGAISTADTTLTDFVDYLDQGFVPEFIRAETKDCLKAVQELKATVQSSL